MALELWPKQLFVSESGKMARSSMLLQVVKAGQKAARDVERARLADSKARERYQARQNAQNSRDAKRAWLQGMEAQAASMTEDIQRQFVEIDEILNVALETDHFFDLETLRKSVDHPEFTSIHSEPEDAPALEALPEEPVAKASSAIRILGWALPGSAKKYLADSAKGKLYNDVEAWKSKVMKLESENKDLIKQWKSREAKRLRQLSKDLKAYELECLNRENEIQEANTELESLIEGLPRGKKDAVETYMSFVLGESEYPSDLEPDCDVSFDEITRELAIDLGLREPSAFTDVASYRFQKSTGEFLEKKQSQREIRARYESYVCSSTLRAIYEVLDSDRYGVIRLVSLIAYVDHVSPGTGKDIRTNLVEVATDRESFQSLNLETVVPMDTLVHLRAVLSKNMVNLAPTQTSKSIRKA